MKLKNSRFVALAAVPVACSGLAAGIAVHFRLASQSAPPVTTLATAAVRPAVQVAGPAPFDPILNRARAERKQQGRVLFSAFSGGVPSRKQVALTFDDGPDPTVTPQILDILKREDVPATFFVVGSKAERFPDLIRREVSEGHDLGNHTFDHFELTGLSVAGARFEIERTNQALQQIVGAPTRWFRAPGCHYTPEALQAIRETGMVRVDTLDNSGDWANPGVNAILRRTLSHLSPGDVILCHDRIPQTVEALPKLIRTLHARGYEVVPLAQLALRAQAKGFHPITWPRSEGVQIQATHAPVTPGTLPRKAPGATAASTARA